MYINPIVSPLVSLRFAWQNLLIVLSVSLAVAIWDDQQDLQKYTIPFQVINTLGTAVSLLLAFRNNSAYGRWWEARTVWGGILNQSRNFARELFTYPQPNNELGSEEWQSVRREILYRHLAYINALRLRLRQQDSTASCWFELSQYLSPDEKAPIETLSNKPVYLLQRQAARLKDLYDAGVLTEYTLVQLSRTLNEFFNLQGACERIKNTPLPRQYAYYTKLFTWIFVLLLPFGFIEMMGWLSVPVSVLLSWIFLTVEAVGHYTENPFDNGINDIPMSALCRTIEIDLRQMLGEEATLKPIQPVKGVLM